jgi:hypothetical protein
MTEAIHRDQHCAAHENNAPIIFRDEHVAAQDDKAGCAAQETSSKQTQ